MRRFLLFSVLEYACLRLECILLWAGLESSDMVQESCIISGNGVFWLYRVQLVSADREFSKTEEYEEMELQNERTLYVACCIECGTPIHESDRADGRCYCSKCEKYWWVNIGRGKVSISEDDPAKARVSAMVNGIMRMNAACGRRALVY